MAPPSVLFGITGAFCAHAGDLQPQRPYGFPTCSMAGPPSGVQMFSALSDTFLINQSGRPIAGPASWLMASVRALTDVRQVSKHKFSDVHSVLPHRSRALCLKCASPDVPVSGPPWTGRMLHLGHEGAFGSPPVQGMIQKSTTRVNANRPEAR